VTSTERDFQETLRKYLVDKGVLVKDSTLLQIPTREEVSAFNSNHSGGPQAGQPILIDWTSKFSTPWNRQALYVLASQFEARNDRSLGEIEKLCERKLERIRQAYQNSQKMETEQVQERKSKEITRDRRNTRRHGVYLTFHPMNYFLYTDMQLRLGRVVV
jgi:hypothetical protein